MKVICCGCGTHLYDKAADNLPRDAVSHGLCNSCGIRFKAEVGVSLSEYLESISVPAVVVTPDSKVGIANSSARQLLKKDLSEIQGLYGGDVFECAHARQPGGCGSTVHCSGCAIRTSVEKTAETGRSVREFPAKLSQRSKDVDMLISTDMMNGIIFLKIDTIAPSCQPA